jgi:hypothetical protein
MVGAAEHGREARAVEVDPLEHLTAPRGCGRSRSPHPEVAGSSPASSNYEPATRRTFRLPITSPSRRGVYGAALQVARQSGGSQPWVTSTDSRAILSPRNSRMLTPKFEGPWSQLIEISATQRSSRPLISRNSTDDDAGYLLSIRGGFSTPTKRSPDCANSRTASWWYISCARSGSLLSRCWMSIALTVASSTPHRLPDPEQAGPMDGVSIVPDQWPRS